MSIDCVTQSSHHKECNVNVVGNSMDGEWILLTSLLPSSWCRGLRKWLVGCTWERLYAVYCSEWPRRQTYLEALCPWSCHSHSSWCNYTPPCLITFLICASVDYDASSSVSWHADSQSFACDEIHESWIWVLINGCRTPEMSKMHADESSDLRVVAKILRDVFGVSHHVKLATSLHM